MGIDVLERGALPLPGLASGIQKRNFSQMRLRVLLTLNARAGATGSSVPGAERSVLPIVSPNVQPFCDVATASTIAISLPVQSWSRTHTPLSGVVLRRRTWLPVRHLACRLIQFQRQLGLIALRDRFPDTATKLNVLAWCSPDQDSAIGGTAWGER